MPQSIYDNGGMIGATLDFADTSPYFSYDSFITNSSGGSPDFRWSLDGTINEEGGHSTSPLGTLSYTTGLIPTVSRQSAVFDGSSSYLNPANDELINTGLGYVWTKRSISFWFNADTTTGYRAIWEEGGGVNWLAIYLEGGYIYANIGEGSTTGGHALKTISAGQTYHCLVTVDLTLPSDNIKIYLNGGLTGVATSTVGTDLAGHGGNVLIGYSDSRNHLDQTGIWNVFDGRLQDVCYWNEEALTLTDAQNIYNSGVSGVGNRKNSGIWSLSSILESIVPPYEFVGSFEDIAGLSTTTFSNISIGSPGLVVVSVGAEQAGASITGVTIGGVTASVAVAPTPLVSEVQGLYYAEVPSSTLIDVVVTFSTNVLRSTVGVWKVNSYTSATPAFTYFDQGSTAIRSITTASLSAGSVVIAGLTEQNVGTASWNGPKEDYDTSTSEANSNFSGASMVAPGGLLDIVSTVSAPNSNTLTVAVWE